MKRRKLGTSAQQRDAAARYDAFLDRGPRGVQGVLDARLLFLHFDLRGGANPDHCHAPRQLGDPLLQLLLVVVAGRLVDLTPNSLDTRFHRSALARPADEGRAFLLNLDALGAAQIL
ncbi:hypothetical protein D9M69_620400 [compost metagenome]